MNLNSVEYMQQVKKQPGIRGKLVLYYHDEEKLTPYQMLNESCTKSGLELHLRKTGQINGSLYEHAILIGNETIVTDFAENNKTARDTMAPKALKILEDTCYAVIVKHELIGQNIRKWDLQNNFRDYNLKTEDRIYRLLENYANNPAIYKLIFHNDFNQAERRIIHEVASKLKLKSKSMDKTKKSVLVVTKKFSLWEIVEYLLKNRYSGGNYELKIPEKLIISVDLRSDRKDIRSLYNENRKRKYDLINHENSNSLQNNDLDLWNHFYTITDHYYMQRQFYDNYDRNKKNMSLSDIYLLNRVQQQSGCRGKIVLFKNSGGDLSNYQMIIESAQKSQLEVLVKRTGETKNNLLEFALEISNEEIIRDFAENNKQAKEILGQKAWSSLQESCFTITVKTLLKGRLVYRKEIDNLRLDENVSKDDRYLGNNPKIIKLMGSVGRNSERRSPIEMTENLRHLGLNFCKENNLDVFQKKIIKYLENYVINPCTYNLVFFNQYSVNERKIIFEVSLKLKLKAKSFGKEKDRKIVVSKKLTPWEIVEHLLARGDENPNYQLIRPKNIMLYNYFYN